MLSLSVEVLADVDGDWWNQMLAGSPHRVVYQTYHWNKFLKEYLGHDLFFAICRDRDQIVRAMLAFTRRGVGHGLYFERPLWRIANRVAKATAPEITWLQGPVFFGEPGDWPEAFSRLMAEVTRVAGRGRVGPFTLPLGADPSLDQVLEPNFTRSPWATYVVDLTGPEESLWTSLRKSARKAVRKAEAEGIVVEMLGDEEDRRSFNAFRVRCLRQRSARCYSVDNLLVRYRWLRRIDGEDIYVARHEGRVIASLGVHRFGGRSVEMGAHQDAQASRDRLYGGDLIKWEVLRREASLGGTYFDLAGVNPSPVDEKESNIAQYKKKWGGALVPYNVYRG